MILTQVDQGSTTVNINAVLQQIEINISLFVFNRYICQRPGGFCKVSIFFFFFLSQHHINNFTKNTLLLKLQLFKYVHVASNPKFHFRHAKRSTVSVDDVKLVARRSTALVSYSKKQHIQWHDFCTVNLQYNKHVVMPMLTTKIISNNCLLNLCIAYIIYSRQQI